MRHFATLALAALLLAPAALAQTVGLTSGPTIDRPYFHTLDLARSGSAAFPLNSSQDLQRGVVACASSGEDEDGEDVDLGTTQNSFYRVVELGKFSLPDNPELTSVDFGVSVSYFEEATLTADGQLVISTLPAGTDFEEGFSRANLSELASTPVSFATDTLFIATAGFDDPDNPFDGAPALNGDEILVIELAFSDGSQTEENPRQFDARAAGNDGDANGVLYLSSPPGDCDIPPTPALTLGERFVTNWVVTLNINTVGEGGGVVTIGEGRDAGVGETVTVAGTVTRAGGDFVYIQDETGGLVIRQTEGDVFDGVADGLIALGTTVEVTGTLSEFNGLLQINEDDLTDFTVTGTADVPDAQTVTLAEIAADGEDYEGELVTVTGVTLSTTDTEFQARTTYDIADASDMTGAVTLRVPNADDGTADGAAIPSGPLSITGIVGQFDQDDPRDEGYQILLISADDVMSGSVAVGEDPEGRLSLGAVAPNPSAARASVSLTLREAGHATVEVYDLLGRQVATVLDRALAAGTASLDLEVGALPAGTYMVRLSAGGATVVRPFTVAR